jgi:hypothetical protein
VSDRPRFLATLEGGVILTRSANVLTAIALRVELDWIVTVNLLVATPVI